MVGKIRHVRHRALPNLACNPYPSPDPLPWQAGGVWPFSAYDPGGAHGSGNLAPETMSDISAEEWRWQYYQAQAAGPEAVDQVKAQWDAGVAERRQI